MKNIRWWALVALVVSGTWMYAQPAQAVSEAEFQELDQKVKVLERKLEIADENAVNKAKDTPVVSAGKDGFSIASADGSYKLKLKALIQSQGRFFLDDNDHKGVDTFLIRRARPIFEGSLGKQFEFRLMPDFGNGQSTLFDAYGDVKLSPLANLRFGKFRAPTGLELLQSIADTAYPERGLPTSLVPNRDEGVQFFGSINTGVVDYALGVFNGVPDGASGDSDSNDDKDLIGRIFLTPFKYSDSEALNGLSFGIAGSYGKQSGTTNSPGLPSFKTFGQQTYFTYKTSTNADQTAFADGNRTRVIPQLYYAVGSLGILSEYTISEQDVGNAKGSDSIENDAWQVVASYVLTGEKATYRGVQPLAPFDFSKGQWGAWEIVAKYGELNVDDTAFSKGYADPKKSASKAEEVGVGVNWYLSRNVKFQVDYNTTSFTDGAATGDREDENLILTQLQVYY